MLAGAVETLVDAVRAGDVEAVAAMLQEGQPPDGRVEGSTALYTAAAQGQTDVALLLLKRGADPNLRSGDQTEGTPLCAAACHGYLEIVCGLLAFGADANLREDDWWTPLRWAAAHGHVEVARALLDAGADPDLGAPLAEAARRGSLGVARVLLEHGANPAELDPQGRTALEVAEEWAGKDVEAELAGRINRLAGTLESGRPIDKITTTRTPLGDGTELVSVQAKFPDGGAMGADLETGHARIATMLRSRRVPPRP
jgi:ankyrin repeat protein